MSINKMWDEDFFNQPTKPKLSPYERFSSDIAIYRLKCKDESRKAFNYANGCGSKGGVKFPSTMWFVDITTACSIHDIEWELAKNRYDLLEANENFDNNLKLICDQESNAFMKPIRRMRIAKYVSAVELYGVEAYAIERGFK